MDNSANVEFQINQHFVYLHGILQNLEDQMIEILHSQRNGRLRNLIEIQEELQSLETQLQNGILVSRTIYLYIYVHVSIYLLIVHTYVYMIYLCRCLLRHRSKIQLAIIPVALYTDKLSIYKEHFFFYFS